MLGLAKPGVVGITGDTMTLMIGDRVVATAWFSEYAGRRRRLVDRPIHDEM